MSIGPVEMDRQTVLFTYICSQVTQKTQAPKEPQVPIHEGQKTLGPHFLEFCLARWSLGPVREWGEVLIRRYPNQLVSEPLWSSEKRYKRDLIKSPAFCDSSISSSPIPRNTGEFARPSPDANIHLGLSLNECHFGIYLSNIIDYFSKLPFKCKSASLSSGSAGLGSACVRWLVSIDTDNFKALCKYRSYGVAPRLCNVQWHAPETSGFGMFF